MPITRKRFAIGNSQKFAESGFYSYIGVSSTTLSLPSTSSLDAEHDDQVYVFSHEGAHASVLTISASTSDPIFDASIAPTVAAIPGSTGSVNPNTMTAGFPNNTGGVVGNQTKVSYTMTRGCVVMFERRDRLWVAIELHAGNAHSRIVPVSAAYTATVFDSTVRGDTTTAAFTVTLPLAASAFNNGQGQIITVKRFAGANALTVQGNGAELIDGANTYVLSTLLGAVTVQSNGTSWDVISVK